MGECPRGLKTGLRLTGINSTDSVMYMEPMLSRTGVGLTMGWLYRLTWERMGAGEPVWPSGKALSRRTSVRLCFGSPLSSKVVVSSVDTVL